MKKSIFLFIFAFLVASYQDIALANDYVAVKLPNGVNLELPSNWDVFRENQRLRINSVAQSRVGIDFFDASSDLTFVAFFYDQEGKSAAKVNIRYYPDEDLSQADARAASEVEIRELDKILRAGVELGAAKNDGKILAWYGTKKNVLNGFTVFITEYKRSPTKNNSAFHVRLVRIFNKNKSFTLTVSYRENLKNILKPICVRIEASLRI